MGKVGGGGLRIRGDKFLIVDFLDLAIRPQDENLAELGQNDEDGFAIAIPGDPDDVPINHAFAADGVKARDENVTLGELRPGERRRRPVAPEQQLHLGAFRWEDRVARLHGQDQLAVGRGKVGRLVAEVEQFHGQRNQHQQNWQRDDGNQTGHGQDAGQASAAPG
jgi:hypothetical protein